MKTKYKYIHFTKKLSDWGCFNNKSNTLLGTIEWYPRWNQYCFVPNGKNIIFNSTCLLDIVDFIKQLQ
jgi:hypothetical protein